MNIHTQEQKSSLSRAYLVYGTHSDVTYVSEHKVVIENGKAIIQEGQALGENQLRSALAKLTSTQGLRDLQWADEFSVCQSSSLQCWWTPAQRRWMHFESAGLKCSMPANNPALLWISQAKQLLVFALKENAKPEKGTALYHAPLYNVYEDGKVCHGTMNQGEDRDAWVDAFYASTFTHANPPQRKLTKFRTGNSALWKGLMSKQNKAFPVQHLIPMGCTLESTINKLSKS